MIPDTLIWPDFGQDSPRRRTVWAATRIQEYGTRRGGDECSGDAVNRQGVGRGQGQIRRSLCRHCRNSRGSDRASRVSAAPPRRCRATPARPASPAPPVTPPFPELTPFGRRFKIGGYTLQGGDWQGPPISAMYMAGFTHTNSPQDAPPAPGLHTNDNLVSQQVSGFIAGRLYRQSRLVHSDHRRSRRRDGRRSTRPTSATPTRSSCSARTRSGASTPTTRRPSKTRGTRRPPGAGRRSPRPSRRPSARRSTHIEDGYTAIVGGAGPTSSGTTCSTPAVIAYKGLPVPALQALNVGNSTTDAVTNVAPYWRVALEPHWGDSLPDGRHVRHVRPDRARPAVRLSAPTTFSTSASTRSTSMTATSTPSR